jgi:hypothetical protein
MLVFSGKSVCDQAHQSDLVKLAAFLKKQLKKPPASPSRCAWRFIFKGSFSE